jgi:hypothetical protein
VASPLVAGDTAAAMVVWDGLPRLGVAYQWRDGTLPIAGAIESTFVTGDLTETLNCMVRIDNGRGTAVAVSNYVSVVAELPVEPGDSDVLPYTLPFTLAA